MRTCAEMGIPVMVLDRPNPLGGQKVEGEKSQPKGVTPFFAVPSMKYTRKRSSSTWMMSALNI